jgi:DNA relaxase NicK
MKYQNLFSINCDWLQIHVKHERDFLAIENPFYYYKRNGQSKVFREIYNIHSHADGRIIGTYATGANEPIMSVHEGILKIENRELYINPDLKSFVKRLLKKLHLKFLGITRLDIAFDFEKFYMDLDPQDLIKDYLAGKVIKTKNTYFAAHGNQKENHLEYETLTFGKKTSNVYCKMYNKSKELANNFKPYIDAKHRQVFDMKSDIWRLEFSLFSMNAFFKNSDGKEYKFYSLDILDVKNLYGIFIGLFKKFFRFKIPFNNRRLTRLKDLELWHFELSFTELRKIAGNPVIKDSSRSEKIFIKKLHTLANEYRIFDENLEVNAKEVISKMIAIHGLENWAQSKGYAMDETQKDYAENIAEMSRLMEMDLEKRNEQYFEKFDILK